MRFELTTFCSGCFSPGTPLLLSHTSAWNRFVSIVGSRGQANILCSIRGESESEYATLLASWMSRDMCKPDYLVAGSNTGAGVGLTLSPFYRHTDPLITLTTQSNRLSLRSHRTPHHASACQQPPQGGLPQGGPRRARVGPHG